MYRVLGTLAAVFVGLAALLALAGCVRRRRMARKYPALYALGDQIEPVHVHIIPKGPIFQPTTDIHDTKEMQEPDEMFDDEYWLFGAEKPPMPPDWVA